MACEVVAETKEPLSRQSVADLVRRARAALGKKISRSTVWRTLHHAAIKPWQYEHWIFPRDPRFAEKAGPILDLYAGTWEGKPLGPNDYVLSMDEKTSIQARGHVMKKCRPSPSRAGGLKRNTTGMERYNTWQRGTCIAGWFWDVVRQRRGSSRLADWWIRSWSRSLTMMRIGCSLSWIMVRRIEVRHLWRRMRRHDKRIILVHTPVHASWLNQVEIYFSIIQRKVLTPNDFATLDAIRLRLALYEDLSNRTPRPFAWKFTRQDLLNWLKRASPHFLAASAA